MSFLGALLDPRRLPTWMALATALAAGFLLLADEALLRPLHLDGVRGSHGRLLGLAFLGAASFVVLSGLVHLVTRRATAGRMRRRARALDASEKAVLREFVLQRRNTIAVPVNDLAVAGLLTDGTLRQVGGQLQPTPQGLVAAVRVDRTFRRHLEPGAVDLTRWSPSEAERRGLLGKRPAFVGEVARWDAIFQL